MDMEHTMDYEWVKEVIFNKYEITGGASMNPRSGLEKLHVNCTPTSSICSKSGFDQQKGCLKRSSTRHPSLGEEAQPSRWPEGGRTGGELHVARRSNKNFRVVFHPRPVARGKLMALGEEEGCHLGSKIASLVQKG
ncbi:hypothetical protein JOB18_010744 [Solea senegalensis]|uniref:Uncharacterized protein n=1 Tax=Solea senegalensis TaxID=28829 RepID=A0AAV6SEH1_SOLSE|nr:hypothetical protein JOB18_010744 [Solea senegalensis]